MKFSLLAVFLIFMLPQAASAQTLTGTTHDAATGVKKVIVSLESKELCVITQSPESWRCEWDTSNLPSGEYKITVRAWDFANNMGTFSRTYDIDNTPSDNSVSKNETLKPPVETPPAEPILDQADNPLSKEPIALDPILEKEQPPVEELSDQMVEDPALEKEQALEEVLLLLSPDQKQLILPNIQTLFIEHEEGILVSFENLLAVADALDTLELCNDAALEENEDPRFTIQEACAQRPPPDNTS